MKWNEDDYKVARACVHAVAKGADNQYGGIVGQLSVAREIGLPVRTKVQQRKAKSVLTKVMGLAVELAPEIYPGHALVLHRDRTYRLIQETTPAATAATGSRYLKGVSIIDRTFHEMLADSAIPAQAKGALELLRSQLKGEVIMRLFAEADEGGGNAESVA